MSTNHLIQWLRNETAFHLTDTERNSLADRIEQLERENAELRRLYDLRGKALARPCASCGYHPEKIVPLRWREE